MNIDERIEEFKLKTMLYFGSDKQQDEFMKEFRHLIYEVVKECVPEKRDIYTHQQKPNILCGYCNQHIASGDCDCSGFNEAVEQTLQNAKQLLEIEDEIYTFEERTEEEPTKFAGMDWGYKNAPTPVFINVYKENLYKKLQKEIKQLLEIDE